MSINIVKIFDLPASGGIFYYNLELLKRVKVSHITIVITFPVRWDHYTSKLILGELRTFVKISKEINADLIPVGVGLERFLLPSIFRKIFRRIIYPYKFLKVLAYGDIIHFTWPWKSYYLKISKMLDKRIVSNCYDIIPLKLTELYPWPRFKKNIYFWRSSDAVQAISLNTKRDLISLGVEDRKIFVIYPGVNTQLFRPVPKNYARKMLGLSIDKKIILYVGSLEPKRAVPMKAFLQAFNSLTEKYRDLNLILAGPFKYVNKERYNNIIILRNVPREKLPLLYASADVFIFPTLYEGFGIPPLEAMASGTPVIAPFNSSLPEVVGDTGVYVKDPLNPKEWYENVELLLKDESLREYLSKKSVARAKIFSWDRSAEILREMYEILSKR